MYVCGAQYKYQMLIHKMRKKLPGNRATVVLDLSSGGEVVSHSWRDEWGLLEFMRSCAKPIVVCKTVNPAFQTSPFV